MITRSLSLSLLSERKELIKPKKLGEVMHIDIQYQSYLVYSTKVMVMSND